MKVELVSIGERAREKRRAATTSVIAAVILSIAKLAVAIVTGSLGLLSEALHSAVDVAGTALSYAAVRVSDRPPDDTHPYGHAKFESLSALFAVALLGITALGILREAASRILNPEIVPVPGVWGFAVVLFSIVVDYNRSRYLRRIAQKHGSQALAADATHFTTDLYGSIAVLTGLLVVVIGSALGWPRTVLVAADAGAGAIVALIILELAAQLAVRAVYSLTDRVPPGLLDNITAAVRRDTDTLGETTARVRFLGDQAYADVVVGVRRGLSLERTEEISNTVVASVRGVLPHADVVVRTRPEASDEESASDAASIAAARIGLGVHHVRAFSVPAGLKLDMHLEVPASMSLQDAHDQADSLERELFAELPLLHAVAIHIEPRHADAHELSQGDTEEVRTCVERVATQLAGNGIHDVEVLRGSHGYVVSLHCYLPAKMPISEAHSRTADIEHGIRAAVPGIYRLTVHPEPSDDKLHIP